MTTSQRTFSNPLTGDTTDIFLWVALLVLSAVFVSAFWIAKKNTDKYQKEQ